MKRIIILALSILCFSAASFAQTKDTKTVVAQKQAPKKHLSKTQVQQVTTTKASGKKSSVTSNATSTAAKLKKDGTPDKRYKENKTNTSTASGPAKKDGTPDMRYKANKKKTS